jgi:hypothetical protein
MHEMVKLHRGSNDVHLTEMVFEFPEFKGVDDTNPTVMESIALWLMHRAEKPIVQGEPIPKQYINDAMNLLKNGDEDNINSSYDYSDDYSYISNEGPEVADAIQNNQCNEDQEPCIPCIKSPLRTKKKGINNQQHYNTVMTQVKDIVKVCEGNEALWNDVHARLNELLLHVTKEQHSIDKEKTVTGKEKNGTISMFPTFENDHASGRYKSFYERKKRKK